MLENNEDTGCYIIALDKAEIIPPTLYKISEGHINYAKNGDTENQHLRLFGGWYKTLCNLKYAIDNDKWNEPIIIQ